MEKISALIDKLQQLKNEEATLSEMAYYTQLLYAELMCAKKVSENEKQERIIRKKVAVIMPGRAPSMMEEDDSTPVEVEKQPATAQSPEMVEAKTVESAYVAEEMNGNNFQQMEVKSKTLFDEVEHRNNHYVVTDVTAAREINEAIAEHIPSLNDKLKRENIELATKLTDSVSVSDLPKAIGINDKFLFINELFRGDPDMFDRSVKTINGCSSLKEAEYWMERELKVKLGWQDKNVTVQQFYHLIRKRFS